MLKRKSKERFYSKRGRGVKKDSTVEGRGCKERFCMGR
jgi:hypothetical protein